MVHGIICSASDLFVNVGILSFSELERKYVYIFKQRILSSNNALVKCINDSGVYETSSLNLKWNSMGIYFRNKSIIIMVLHTALIIAVCRCHGCYYR